MCLSEMKETAAGWQTVGLIKKEFWFVGAQPLFICLVLHWRVTLWSPSFPITSPMFVPVVARNAHHCGMPENLWCLFPGHWLWKQQFSTVLQSEQASTAGQSCVRSTLVCPTMALSQRSSEDLFFKKEDRANVLYGCGLLSHQRRVSSGSLRPPLTNLS